MDLTPIAQPDDTIHVQVKACFACGGDHTTPLLKLESPISNKGTTFVYRYHCPAGDEVLTWLPPNPQSAKAVCQVVPAISPTLIPHTETTVERTAREANQKARKSPSKGQ